MARQEVCINKAPPLVNVCKAPGEWQTYDIIFTAPRFSENGYVIAPARITVIQNGVLGTK